MDEGARGIAQIECLMQGRMFMEHLVSVSEDIGKEETPFSLCTFKAHCNKKKKKYILIFTEKQAKY